MLPGLARLLLQYPAVQCFAETVFGGAGALDEADSAESDALESKKSPLLAPKTEEESSGGATYFTK